MSALPRNATEPPHVFRVKLENLQPSQLYFSKAKLQALEARGAEPEQPLPVIRRGERFVLTDGHTRAVLSALRGRTEIEVYLDTDELDREAYEICVRWCLHEGVASVFALADRGLEAHEFEELWLERCRQLHVELAKQRSQ